MSCFWPGRFEPGQACATVRVRGICLATFWPRQKKSEREGKTETETNRATLETHLPALTSSHGGGSSHIYDIFGHDRAHTTQHQHKKNAFAFFAYETR